jgi:putative autotransporter adhesin-like protein
MSRFLRRVSLAAVALLIGLLAVSVLAPVSQDARAQGEDKTITKDLEPFTSIQINGGGKATLEFGPAPSVTIEGNSLVVDRLDAKVEDGTLILGSLLTSALDVTGLSDLTYTIVTPSIEAIHLAGTVDLHVAPMMNQQSLELGLTTGSEVFIPAISTVSITGKLDLLSTAHLAGSASTLQMQVFNGSTLDAEQLQVQTADLEVKGVSTATVRVSEALTGTASEGSKVRYMTDDVIPALTTSSLASIQQVASTPWQAPVNLEPLATPTS